MKLCPGPSPVLRGLDTSFLSPLPPLASDPGHTGGERPGEASPFSDVVLAAAASPAPLCLPALAGSGSPAQVRWGHGARVVSRSPGLPPASGVSSQGC